MRPDPGSRQADLEFLRESLAAVRDAFGASSHHPAAKASGRLWEHHRRTASERQLKSRWEDEDEARKSDKPDNTKNHHHGEEFGQRRMNLPVSKEGYGAMVIGVIRVLVNQLVQRRARD